MTNGGPVPERSSERAAAIAELSLQLAEPTSTAVLQDLVVERVSLLVRDAAALWRRDDEGHIGLVATTHHDPVARAYVQREAPDATHSDVHGILPHVWRTAEPVLLSGGDLRQWLPLMQPAYRDYAEHFGMVSLLLVPLLARGRVVAMLGVSRDRAPELDEDDVRFVSQIGAVIAVALDNDRLLRQARSTLSEQNRAHLAAHRAAVHDPLTGLPNRRLLLERLHGVGAREDQQVELLIVDLDSFKDVNDSYGHGAGDAALVEVARRLEAVVHAAHLGSRTTLARLGGDEFAVMVVLPLAGAAPTDLPVRILAALGPPLASVDGRVRVTASIGVAHGAGTLVSTLLRHADIAMYRAKRTRSGWARYEAEHDSAAQVRLHELHDLDRALSDGQLAVHYQPVVPRPASADGGPRLVEALVRWTHPSRGLLAPAQFLPLVQQSGRMGRLTQEVVRSVLADLARWQRAGLVVQASVNVGADVLGDSAFLPDLLDDLSGAGLAPSAVCLELTESEVLSADGPTLLAQVRASGLTVALDDFGTGWSSLSYLVDLPLDRLKLDRSFVRRLSGDDRMARFVGGLVDLVHGLGLPVIAEGVETAGEAVHLDGLAVEHQQGFLHSRPLPADDLERFWHAQPEAVPG